MADMTTQPRYRTPRPQPEVTVGRAGTDGVKPRTSKLAALLLFIMILVVGIGPRIGLGFIDAEIRIQDLLIVPMMLYLLLSVAPTTKLPVQRLFGNALPIFLWGSFVVVLLSVLVFPEVSMIRRVAYYGRTIEMFFLAVIIAGLYLRSGHKALNTVIAAVNTGAIINLLWMLYQLATGTAQTLVGQEVGNQIESYGPKLLGEPSAFGTGQYWVFVAAVAAARIKSGNRYVLNLVLVAGALAGSWFAESRISVGSILIIVALVLILGKDRRRWVNITGALTGMLLGLIGLIQIVPALAGRVSPEAIQTGFEFRIRNIWAPFFELVLSTPLIGIGPGGLQGEMYLAEAHNIVLRAMLDFGVIVGVLLIFLLIRALVRGFNLARFVEADQTTRIAGYIGAFCILSTLISGQVQDALTAVMSSHLLMVGIGILAAQRALWMDQHPWWNVKRS